MRIGWIIKTAFVVALVSTQVWMGAFAVDDLGQAQVRKEFYVIRAAYYKNPSYSNVGQSIASLESLKNKTTWLIKNPRDPLTLEFKEFHMGLLEIEESNSLLDACTDGDKRLQQKVDGITNSWSRTSAQTTKNRCSTCSLRYPADVLDDMDKYSLVTVEGANGPISKLSDQVGTIVGNLTPVLDDKEIRKEILFQKTQAISDYLGTKNVYQGQMREIVGKSQSNEIDYEVMQITRKVDYKLMPVLDKKASDYLKTYTKKKYGFDLKDPEEKTKNARKLKDLVMEGNRNNCFRNYLYFSQRFNFSDEPDLTGDDNYRKLESKAVDMFGRWTTAAGWRTLPEYEEQEIARMGQKDIKKLKAAPKLSQDDVYKALKPTLDLLIASQASKDASKRISFGMYDEQYKEKMRKKFELSTQAGNKQSEAYQTVQREVAFLLYTEKFQEAVPRLGKMNEQEIKNLLKTSLKRAILDNDEYSKKWVSKVQGDYDFLNREKSDSEHDDANSFALYSSPGVIQGVIAKNPTLMGSLCGPLKAAADLRRTKQIPGYINATTMVASFLGPAGTAFSTALGFVSTVAVNSQIADDNKKLQDQSDYAGLGDYVVFRDWNNVSLDKESFKKIIERNKSAMTQNWVFVAATELGGRAINRTVGSFTRVGSQSKSLAKDLAFGGMTQAEIKVLSTSEREALEVLIKQESKVIKELTKNAEAALGNGKKLDITQMNSLYKAYISGDLRAGLRSGAFTQEEIDLIVTSAKKIPKKPIAGTRTEFGPGLGRDIFKSGELDEILKVSGPEGLQKELEKIGLKTKKIVLERDIEIDGRVVTRKYNALIVDPALLSEANTTSNHLVNYLRRSQQRAGSGAPGVDVIFRLDDYGVKELGEFSQIGKIKEVTLSKKVLEDYLKTGNAGPIIKHEYRHYLLYNKAGVNDDLQIIFEGMPVAGYEERMVMHEYYNYHRQVWEEFSTPDVRNARLRIFKQLDDKELLTKSDLNELVRQNGALNSAARRSNLSGLTSNEMNEGIISFTQEFKKLKTGLSSENAVIHPSQYGVTVDAKINGKWVTADFPCKSCELLANDLTGAARSTVEQKIKEEVGVRLDNLYKKAIKERALFNELKTIDNKIEFHIFGDAPVSSNELKELYRRQEKIRQEISKEVGLDSKTTQNIEKGKNIPRPSQNTNRIVSNSSDKAYGLDEGIGEVNFSGNKEYLGGTNILVTETEPDRVNAFRDAFMKGKIPRDMKISFQYGKGGSWESQAYVVGYDKSKGLVRVRVGSDTRNTMVLDEYQIMTAKEIPNRAGKFDSQEFKLERFSFDREVELVVVAEKTAPKNSVKISSEKPNTVPPTQLKDGLVNSGLVMSEITTSTGTYKLTHKQEMAYTAWRSEKPKTHPGITGLNASSPSSYLHFNETGIKGTFIQAGDTLDSIKVRALDGKILELKNPIFLSRTGLFLNVEVDGVKKVFYWREVMQVDGKGLSLPFNDPKPFQLQP